MHIIRRLLTASLLASLVALRTVTAIAGAPQECRDLQACRQLALEAKERKDFEAFHDLAWKVMGLGPKNDPASMTLLARAQSMSGRPLDALVMLQRLANMGVITDAATSDDFERVRALPSWNDAAAKLSGKVSPETAVPAAAPPKAAEPLPKPAPPDRAAGVKPKPAVKETVAPPPPPPVVPPVPEKPPATEAPAAAEKATRSAKGAAGKVEPAPLTVAGVSLNSVGLAYDAVSGRFILGDRADRRLMVFGERSGRLASLAGADAGFNELTALEIDSREGDLWVVSAASATRSSTVHKLQLISGRVLLSVPLPDDQVPARFTDVAITPQSVLILDSDGRRIFRAAKKGRTLDVAMRLAVASPTTLAPAAEGVAYVAYDEGILRADLAARAMSVVEPPAKADIRGISWMRWFRGSLVAIQAVPAHGFRLVRIRLDESGRAVRGVDVLDENVALAGSTSAAISENVLYYLNRAADSADVIVRKVPLK
jgi:hypothetical protein